MKFLMVCICAMVAASSASKMNRKRGVFGSPEADVMNNYVVEQHGFNDDTSNGGFDSRSQYNDYNSNENHFGSSSHSDFPHAPAHTSSYISFPPNDNNNNQFDHQGSRAGYSPDYRSSAPANAPFNAEPVQNHFPPSQNFDGPHELVKTRHSESIEKGRFPVQVPRTIVKTIHVERHVPQPYEVIKHVPQPFPVQRVRAVVKEVPVPQPVYINKEIVRHVPVERLVHKPVPIIKYVHVPVEHQVPVYVHNPEQVYQAPVAHHSVITAPIAHQSLVSHAPFSTSYGVPQTYAHSYSGYGLPQTYSAAHSYGSYGESIAHTSLSHAPLVAAQQGW